MKPTVERPFPTPSPTTLAEGLLTSYLLAAFELVEFVPVPSARRRAAKARVWNRVTFKEANSRRFPKNVAKGSSSRRLEHFSRCFRAQEARRPCVVCLLLSGLCVDCFLESSAHPHPSAIWMGNVQAVHIGFRGSLTFAQALQSATAVWLEASSKRPSQPDEIDGFNLLLLSFPTMVGGPLEQL